MYRRRFAIGGPAYNPYNLINNNEDNQLSLLIYNPSRMPNEQLLYERKMKLGLALKRGIITPELYKKALELAGTFQAPTLEQSQPETLEDIRMNYSGDERVLKEREFWLKRNGLASLNRNGGTLNVLNLYNFFNRKY